MCEACPEMINHNEPKPDKCMELCCQMMRKGIPFTSESDDDSENEQPRFDLYPETGHFESEPKH